MQADEVLRVRNWDVLYENNRTREYKKLNWVPIPNKMDGDGYTELVDHANGAAHLGAWLAIVQVASRCDVRGVLMRDGGRPHDVASLARITRLPREVFDEVLPRLMAIGWLEDAAKPQEPEAIRQDAAEISQDAAEPGQFEYVERNGTERNRKELRTNEDAMLLSTPERIKTAQVAIGAHRGRGDEPDPTITRKVLLAFPDAQMFDAWLKDIKLNLNPSEITGTGYALYVSDAGRFVRNGGTRKRRKAAPAPAVMQRSTVDPETRRRIEAARPSPYFDVTTITGKPEGEVA